MTARFLSLWMPRFTCDWLDRQQPGLRLRPVAITTKEKGGQAIVGYNVQAIRLGIRAGMKLADANALEPKLLVFDDDPVRDQRALDALAGWCERFTPFVAIDVPGGLYLDITGCAHLFGGEQALLQRVLGSLRQIGYESYAAIADTPGAAWAIARYATSPERSGIVVPPERQAQALERLPVSALRLSGETETVLQRLGLRRIGELYAIKRAALAKRFGPEVLLRLDQALGNQPEPISPRRPTAEHIAKELFVEPISTREAIEAATFRMLETLCANLVEASRGARMVELRWWRVDGEVGEIQIGTSAPSRAPKHLLRLFAERLDKIDPGFGIEAMALHAVRTDVMAVSQLGMDTQNGQANLAALIDRLSTRFGKGVAVRFAPAESWLPERAVRKVPVFSQIKARPWPVDRPRPLRLLPEPEAIEVVAMLPDDPPVLVRWKGSPRRIIRAEGPERIEPEWWKRGEPSRDYYRIEDQEGRRYWVYRAGSYDAAHPPRWYLHGLFA